MYYTSSRWRYFEEEDMYFALIRNELYECLARNDGSPDHEFWLVDWDDLEEDRASRLRAIVKKLKPRSHSNEHWYPYEDDGSYYQLERGILRQCPMNEGDTRDHSPCAVDWRFGVEEEHKPRMRQIVRELRRLP
jgi:hypothetical protein